MIAGIMGFFSSRWDAREGPGAPLALLLATLVVPSEASWHLLLRPGFPSAAHRRHKVAKSNPKVSQGVPMAPQWRPKWNPNHTKMRFLSSSVAQHVSRGA